MKISSVMVVLLLVQAMILVSVDAQGTWQIINKNAGIATMHAAVTHFDTVILLDRTNTGATQINLPNGRCRDQPLERVLKKDCTAHSVMLTASSGAVRPLFVFTDTWCSSGQFFDTGMMVQTGGDFEGNKKIRTLAPCAPGGTCDWTELAEPLAAGRWYSSNQLLQSGTRQIIVGGRAAANYEFYPKRKAGEGTFPLALLGGCCDNLYPFVFLLPNGDLFIFTTRDSVALNWGTGKVTRKYPTIPGNPRNYPSAGSAVMLPLSFANGFATAEILVCGGAATGASGSNNVNAPASKSCGRIVATAGAPGWAMEDMPIGRTMGDMLNMPNGEVLIINGAQNGFQGWGKANNPAFNPVSYNPGAGAGKRFTTLAKTGIARLYHSTANLLSDGRVLIAGSNTHQFYTFTGAFPTELRVEAFSPPYLGANFNAVRPTITGAPGALKYNLVFTMTFTVTTRVGGVGVYQNSAPYSTHSYSQGQRSLLLKTTAPVKVGAGYSMQVTAAPNNNIAPPAYYILFCVQNGIPSRGKWVKQNN
ncbi:hypothetical protein M758_4G257000 [Ceratodon purpureus]|nr:hypothetical protein M758_4G257000 [Ceratodon purpureus]KAG0620949.1 hypothetical protein M758_4G257000 [Ceratodon purpureus]